MVEEEVFGGAGDTDGDGGFVWGGGAFCWSAGSFGCVHGGECSWVWVDWGVVGRVWFGFRFWEVVVVWESGQMSVGEFEEEFAVLCGDDRAVAELDRLVECEVFRLGDGAGVEFRVVGADGVSSGLPVVREFGEALRMCVEVNGGGGGPLLRGVRPFVVECRLVGEWGLVGG